jgi:hypothetical protein
MNLPLAVDIANATKPHKSVSSSNQIRDRSSVAVIEFAAGDRFWGEGRFRGIEGGGGTWRAPNLPTPQNHVGKIVALLRILVC